jgi:DNA replication and repair protein RecF
MIKTLSLTNYRNYSKKTLEFTSNTVVLQGPNGCGKTNLLEAIFFVSILRSFRGSSPKELVKIGEKDFAISLTLERKKLKSNLTINQQISGKRNLFINNNSVNRSSNFIKEFRAVPFVPEDRLIVSGSSSYRRRFFDSLISTIAPDYFTNLLRYSRALEQRNKALKESPKLASSFEVELIETSPKIAFAREIYASQIAFEVNNLLGEDRFNIVRKGDVRSDSTEVELFNRFASTRDKEKLRGYTANGPHLDEFDLFLDNKLLRNYGSTGQVRIISLLLRLAEFNIVSNRGTLPFVLIDDVTGDLDEKNKNLFYKVIEQSPQKFFTFATQIEKNDFDNPQVIPLSLE